MTIDLESLRNVPSVMNSAADDLESEGAIVSAQSLWDARSAVEDAIAELTARRARDAEVEAALNAARDDLLEEVDEIREMYRADDYMRYVAPIRERIRQIDECLLPFTGDKT